MVRCPAKNGYRRRRLALIVSDAATVPRDDNEIGRSQKVAKAGGTSISHAGTPGGSLRGAELPRLAQRIDFVIEGVVRQLENPIDAPRVQQAFGMNQRPGRVRRFLTK